MKASNAHTPTRRFMSHGPLPARPTCFGGSRGAATAHEARVKHHARSSERVSGMFVNVCVRVRVHGCTTLTPLEVSNSASSASSGADAAALLMVFVSPRVPCCLLACVVAPRRVGRGRNERERVSTGLFLPNGARPLLTSVLFLVLVSAHYSLSLTLQDQDKGPVENKAFKCVVRFQTCLV